VLIKLIRARIEKSFVFTGLEEKKFPARLAAHEESRCPPQWRGRNDGRSSARGSG
jgi:hypothetical protein